MAQGGRCVSASSGKITVASLTKALKDSKKSRGIVETSMTTTRSRQGHMARAAACVFASNYAPRKWLPW